MISTLTAYKMNSNYNSANNSQCSYTTMDTVTKSYCNKNTRNELAKDKRNFTIFSFDAEQSGTGQTSVKQSSWLEAANQSANNGDNNNSNEAAGTSYINLGYFLFCTFTLSFFLHSLLNNRNNSGSSKINVNSNSYKNNNHYYYYYHYNSNNYSFRFSMPCVIILSSKTFACCSPVDLTIW